MEFIGFRDELLENYEWNNRKEIDHGSRSTIYNCLNLTNNIHYAIKQFNPVKTIEDYLENLKEVFCLNRIRENPYTIKLHQIFGWSEKNKDGENLLNLIIVLDLFEESLEKLIKKSRENKKEIPDNMIEKIAKRLIEGFNNLIETENICHRDIKPANLLFDKNSQIKICDFDVSKISSSKSKLLVFIIIYLKKKILLDILIINKFYLQEILKIFDF